MKYTTYVDETKNYAEFMNYANSSKNVNNSIWNHYWINFKGWSENFEINKSIHYKITEHFYFRTNSFSSFFCNFQRTKVSAMMALEITWQTPLHWKFYREAKKKYKFFKKELNMRKEIDRYCYIVLFV